MEHFHGSSHVEQAITITGAQEESLRESWDRIIVPLEIKERLLNHALMAIELRKSGVAGIGLPLHGPLLISGMLPGVGKSSLARGLGSQVSAALGARYGPVRVLDVNLHVLPSELLGRTQRNIIQIFEEELPALAEDGPLIVILDEIEALAVSRAKSSLETNPADVFRGMAALLSALDWVAREVPGVVVVGTTNIPDTVRRRNHVKGRPVDRGTTPVGSSDRRDSPRHLRRAGSLLPRMQIDPRFRPTPRGRPDA